MTGGGARAHMVRIMTKTYSDPPPFDPTTLSRGDIIFYPFLWTWERDRYGDTPSKDRECVVNLIYEWEGEQHVLLLPVTATEPFEGQAFFELPKDEVARVSRNADRLFVRLDETDRERVRGSPHLARADRAGRLGGDTLAALYTAWHAT